MDELLACPGIGPTKVRRLHDTFHEAFRRTLQPADGESAGTQAATGTQAAGPQQPSGAIAAGTAAIVAVANDGIAEIGGDEDEIEADNPNAGAFLFL